MGLGFKRGSSWSWVSLKARAGKRKKKRAVVTTEKPKKWATKRLAKPAKKAARSKRGRAFRAWPIFLRRKKRETTMKRR